MTVPTLRQVSRFRVFRPATEAAIRPRCACLGASPYYTVFVIDLASRRVQVLGSTPHPESLFMMKNGEVQLVFNTTGRKQSPLDSFSLHRTALLMHIPDYTTASGALACAKTIAAVKAGSLDARPLQSYG